MNNFSVNDKFRFYTYSLSSLLVTDFQFDWVSFLITTPFDALPFFCTIQLEKFLPLLVRWRRCLPPRSATPHLKSCPPDSVNPPLLQCPLHAPDLLRSPLSIAAPNAFHRSASASYQFTVTGRISDRRFGDLWCTTSWTVVAIGSKRFPCAFSYTHLPSSGFCRRLFWTHCQINCAVV